MTRPADALERFKRTTRSKLDAVRCPDHRQPPRLRFDGRTLGEVNVSMSGCCRKLMTLANAAIAGAEVRGPLPERRVDARLDPLWPLDLGNQPHIGRR